uniref:Uncharacterized protein n=1 Tax=Monodelphis domestica TaxID=13616 RepID=A0A5F8H8P7_MONDO
NLVVSSARVLSMQPPPGKEVSGGEEVAFWEGLEKHPLENRWFFKSDKSRAQEDSLHLITKSDAMKDFWISTSFQTFSIPSPSKYLMLLSFEVQIKY